MGAPGALVVKASGLGYSPIPCMVLMLWAWKCRLTFPSTGIAWYVMSNASSQTSSRWHVRCDDITCVITGVPFQWSISPLYERGSFPGMGSFLQLQHTEYIWELASHSDVTFRTFR